MDNKSSHSPLPSPHPGRFPLERDLSPLIHALKASGIIHRIAEQDGQQHLLLAEGQNIAQVQAVLLDFDHGQLSTGEHSANAEQPSLQDPINSKNIASTNRHLVNKRENNGLIAASLLTFYRAPVTLILIIMGIAGWLAYISSSDVLFYALLFVSESYTGQLQSPMAILAPWESQQWWRLAAPIFLHFSWWHIALNGLAMLQIGSAIERLLKWRLYLAFCLLTGVIGNIAQYFSALESPVFGGLSGIVFALFAFNAVLQWKSPQQALKLPVGFYLFSLVWLASGFTPVFEFLFGAQMGNGAHLGGAIAGALLAFSSLFFGKHDGSKHD